MGATGASGSGVKRGDTSQSTFGLKSARRLEDSANPKGARFSTSGDNIVIAASSDEGKDIVFQFKLLKGDKMGITAYDPNIPNRGKVSVNADRPSLDSVISNPKASSSEKSNAMKIRDMMQRTESGIKESSLGRIANELKKRKLRKPR